MTNNNQPTTKNWKKYLINNAVWVVPSRYSDLAPIGHGAYGLVWLVIKNINHKLY